MDKLNYRYAVTGNMPMKLDGDEMVRVIYFDGESEYNIANLIDWYDVEMYAIVGEE